MTLPDLSALDAAVLNCINEATGRPRFCAKNALLHMERAWALADSDPEMAIFRAITAEEEAATAIFLVAKQRQYSNANRLNHRKHEHKQALFPFLMAINNFLASFEGQLPPISLAVATANGSTRLVVRLHMPDGRIGLPDPPLHFSVTGESEQRRERFVSQLASIAAAAGATEITGYLRNVANMRNLLLYASDQGVPRLSGDVQAELAARQDRVLVLLRVFCLIFPYQEHAMFVQQVLDAFLIAVGGIQEEDLLW